MLTAAIKSKIIPPAYLFSGITGGGKTTNARLLAMSLNCRNLTLNSIEPCGECVACRDILNDRSEYLIEVDGATKGGVEDIRSLMASIRYVVPNGSYRVVIIDECHSLSKQAWQAALKTIEEPPRNTVFVFCTTEIQKVIPTIMTRCVKVQFQGVEDSVIVKMLQNILKVENVQYDEDSLGLIAKYAKGSIRDAQSILEGFIRSGKVTTEMVEGIYRTVDPSTVLTYFNYVVGGDLKGACIMAANWLKIGVSPEYLVAALLEHLRNMLMDFTVKDTSLKALLKSQKEKIGESRVVDWIQFFYDQLRFIRDYPMDYALVIDLITIRLVDSLNERKPRAKAEKTEKSEKVEKQEKPEPPKVARAIDRTLLNRLQTLCEGQILHCSPTFSAVTLKTPRATFDVVSDVSLVRSDYYILSDSLSKIIEGFPASMNDETLFMERR
jgi:DNA polymerase III subunit gamma/tau